MHNRNNQPRSFAFWFWLCYIVTIIAIIATIATVIVW